MFWWMEKHVQSTLRRGLERTGPLHLSVCENRQGQSIAMHSPHVSPIPVAAPSSIRTSHETDKRTSQFSRTQNYSNNHNDKISPQKHFGKAHGWAIGRSKSRVLWDGGQTRGGQTESFTHHYKYVLHLVYVSILPAVTEEGPSFCLLWFAKGLMSILHKRKRKLREPHTYT